MLKKRKGYFYDDLKWYSLRITLQGKTVSVSVDGVQVMEYVFDSTPDLSGSVGLLNYSQDQVMYKNLTVSSSDGESSCYKVSCDDPSAVFNSDKATCTKEGCEEDSFLERDGKCYKKSY